MAHHNSGECLPQRHKEHKGRLREEVIIFNIFNGDKPSTIKTRALNCRKIQQAINWKPTVSVGEGIKHTTKWWIKNRRWWEK